MNKEQSDDLIRKYLAAETSLDDEERLFSSRPQVQGLDAWSTYVRKQRKKAPPQLNASIMTAIQARKTRKQRFLYGVSAAAAAIALLVATFLYHSGNEPGYEEKEALLKDALSMFPDEKPEPEKQTILYEDEMIIIYLAPN